VDVRTDICRCAITRAFEADFLAFPLKLVSGVATGVTYVNCAALHSEKDRMNIYLFRDESSADVFAFSIGVTGRNIPPVTPHTEWIFLEAMDAAPVPGCVGYR
jgi:hypothetical protein